jgi:hypothetical protein
VFTQDHNVVFGVRELPAPELVNQLAAGPAGKGRPASNAGQRRRADDNSDHPLRAETLLGAELISRYDVPPSQHR